MKTQDEPKVISQERLVRMFKDIKQLKSEDTRFCFLIGAGASKSSGIKTGWELAVEWYKALQEDLTEEELSDWKDSIGFDEEKIGEFYPYLYQKRYEANDQLGYDEFKKLMENIDPGLGYVILSQILVNEKHNFVITTNFDYLVEDAVRMFTAQKPFIAGHETLAEFISSNTERPTIIKVHRDLFLHPFNDKEGTDCLKQEWEKALAPILSRFHLLVIGYGGNDGSLMQYLKKIPVENRKSIYWCVLKENSELNVRTKDLLTNKDFIVRIDGFDELMYAFNTALDYDIFSKLDKLETHPFVEAAKGRLTELDNKLKQLLASIQQTKKPVSNATKELFTGANKYLYDAYIEKDIDRQEKTYREGIAKYPANSDLLGYYAVFLTDIKKEYDRAEEHYKKAIEADPKNANSLGNYAVFLTDIRKDYDSAEKYYKKAIKISSQDAVFSGNYALFLTDIRKNYDNAEAYYKKAIAVDPKNTNNLGNYALFLHNIRKDYDSAEEYYKKAIASDPKHANTLGNYALFLHNIREDYDSAEEYYKKAIAADSKHANTLGIYAWFLHNIREDYDSAEEYYKKAITSDPKHANNLGNYALLLHNIRKDYDSAEAYYKKAIVADPKHANNLGNYALFLHNVRKNYDSAEEYYKKSIAADPKHANTLGNYAVFLHNIRKDYDSAEAYYKKAIAADPKQANTLCNYALLLHNIRKDYDSAKAYYKKAIEVDPKHVNSLGNYASLLYIIKKDYDSAEAYYKKAIAADPKHANNLGNYAHFLILHKKDFETAEKYIDQAFEVDDNENIGLLSELWFYRFAHYPKWYEEAEKQLEELIGKGAKSIGWNLQDHITIAEKQGHPKLDKLKEFAQQITT
ncbi:MAG: hypothetical protein H6Q17_793 [Bacteroidetes bacterium]|nr:hypothetical protein [Bacteroidota bacterium]